MYASWMKHERWYQLRMVSTGGIWCNVAEPLGFYHHRAGDVKTSVRSDASAILSPWKLTLTETIGTLCWSWDVIKRGCLCARAHMGACQVDHVSCPYFETCLQIFISDLSRWVMFVWWNRTVCLFAVCLPSVMLGDNVYILSVDSWCWMQVTETERAQGTLRLLWLCDWNAT